MARHVDIYRCRVSGDGDDEMGRLTYNHPPRRVPEAVAIHWESLRGLPYDNGYTYTTAIHDDGECEEHRPDDEVCPWITSEEWLDRLRESDRG